jgi:hypothetical protein
MKSYVPTIGQLSVALVIEGFALAVAPIMLIYMPARVLQLAAICGFILGVAGMLHTERKSAQSQGVAKNES